MRKEFRTFLCKLFYVSEKFNFFSLHSSTQKYNRFGILDIAISMGDMKEKKL